MKKTLLFFTFFLFFGLLAAEEAQIDKYDIEDTAIIVFAERAPEPEKEQKTGSNTEEKECCCDVSRETNEKPKSFYIQPAAGFGTGFSLFRTTFSLVADFLVKKGPKINYYVGVDVEARATYLIFETKELAVQANVVFDFIQKGVPKLKSASLWIAYGIDLRFVREREEDYWDDLLTFRYFQAWGIGVDLFFTNNMIMRFGLDGFWGIYPDVTILVGYRF